MNFKQDYLPNYKSIISAFPIVEHRKGVVFTYGDTLFAPHQDESKIQDHLFLGTHQDNSIDAYKKGRIAPPVGSQFKSGEDHVNVKLSDEDVVAIRKEYSTTKISMRKLGKKYNGRLFTCLANC